MNYFDILLAKKLSGGGVQPTPQIVDKTVKGNPLNFITQFAQLAKETVISLAPIQDLHGYDHPWPEGGWKNKLPISVAEGEVSGITATKVYDNAGNAIGVRLTGNNSGSSALYRIWNFTLPAGNYVYDSGYADDEASPSAISDSMIQLNEVTIARGNDSSPGHNFTIAEDSTLRCLLRIRANKSNVDVLYQPMIRLSTETDPTFAPYSNICPIDGRTETSLVGTNGKESTDPDYVVSNNLTLQFGEKVYGVKVELEKGTVTVDTAIVDMGTLNWIINSTGEYFYANLADKANNQNNICSIYKLDTSSVALMADKTFKGSNSNSNLYVKDSAYTDAETFKTAMSGQQICYELATPRVITLTPNEISLLEGINNISVDDVTGEITLTYKEIEFA